MSCLEFLALTRLHPRLAAVPVIALSTDNTLDAVVAAMDGGCSGYLIRPYSMRSFFRNIRRVLNPNADTSNWSQADDDEAFRMALEVFVPSAEEPDRAGDRYAQGAEHLAAGRLDAAATCFQEAARINPLARGGPTRAWPASWKAKGRPDRVHQALQDASVAMARQGRAFEGNSPLKKLNPDQGDPHGPVLGAAGKLLRRGDFQSAAQIYVQARSLLVPEERILAHITRNCHFTPDPGHAARAMSQELHAMGAVPDPHKTFARLMGPTEPGASPARRAGHGPQAHDPCCARPGRLPTTPFRPFARTARPDPARRSIPRTCPRGTSMRFSPSLRIDLAARLRRLPPKTLGKPAWLAWRGPRTH